MELQPAGMALLALGAAAGAAIQAATGFGFAILAAPVFLAVLDSTAAVPILIALHVVQSAVLVPRLWSGVPWRALGLLSLGAAAGCPLGLWLFHALDVRQLKLAAGIVILGVAALLALRRLRSSSPPPSGTGDERREATASTVVAGTAAGALTAILVMPGPPLMIHLLRHSMPHAAARALSLTFFAACYVAVFATHVTTGSFDRQSWATIAILLLPVLLGTALGLRLAPLLAARHFALVLNLLLVAAGLGALLSAL